MERLDKLLIGSDTQICMASVVLEKVSKSFPLGRGEGVDAVRNVSLAVEDGELLALVGPSGSGKTTLLRMVAGLEEPTSGTILIGDKVANGLAPKDRDVAMVFQDHTLYPHMTVYQNLAFGVQLRQLARAEIDNRVREAGALLGVTELFERLPRALSGGERQRVALGRALVLKPQVFLLDEPLSNLDAPLRAQMRREISSLHKRIGTTMVYVTHDQAEAMAIADRLAVIRAGALQQAGAPLEIYQRPTNLFVAGFVGVPPMNFFPGTVMQKGGAAWFCGDQAKTGLPVLPMSMERLAPGSAKDVVLGLRPEHLREVTGTDSRQLLAPVVQAAVSAVEPLGSETHVWLAFGKNSCVARFAPGCQVQAGEMIRVTFDMESAHWFDAASGNALSS